MASSIIAVRVANGSYVPVLDTSAKTRRRLVLTTIRDDQTSVQIDLFKGADESMEDAEYVGSLMIESIAPGPKGQADIALLLGVDETGSLNATATDKNSGEYQSLSVGLQTVEGAGYDIPDFELNDEELNLDDISAAEEESELDDPSSLELDDVTLEEDLEFEIEEEMGTDTLAVGAAAQPEELGELDESVSGEELAGLESFSEESISLDESLSDESLGEITESDDQFETVAQEESEAEFDTEELPDLEEGLIEADLGEEDFTFDDAPALDPAVGLEISDDAFSPEEVSAEGSAEESLEEPDENLFEDVEAPVESFDDFTTETAVAGEADSFEFDDFGDKEETEPAAYGAGAEVLAPRRSNPIIFAGYIILSLAALGVITYLVFRLLEGPPAPPLRAMLPVALPLFGARRRRKHRR